MLRDYILIGFRNLFKRKLRSWLTIVGIFIGIAAVVSLIGLGEGLRVAINAQFGLLGSDILTVQAAGLALGPPGSGSINPLTDDLADKLDKVAGVEAVINRYIKAGTLEFNDQQGIGMAVSIAGGDDRKVIEQMLNIDVQSGRLLKDGDGRKVLLGANFAEEDAFDKGVTAGDRVLINDIQYEVVGIMEKKGSFILDNAVLINDEALLEDFGDDGTVSIIGVKVKDVKDIHKVREDLEKVMRKERDVDVGEEDFSVTSPEQTLEALDSTLFAVQLFVTIIATISLLVGGIGITNTMYTAVLERTKEIGIMKAIGAKNSTIFTVFFFESGALGMVGGSLGILTGLGLAYGLAALGRATLGVELIQAHVSLELIIASLIFSFMIGTIAGVLPALQASRKNPVDSMRFK